MGDSKRGRALLAFAAAIALSTWTSSALLWRAGGHGGLAASLFALGVSLGPCLAAFAMAPAGRKQRWRQAVLATGGASILVFSFGERTGLDLEHFLSLLFIGTVGAAIGHTIVTTIGGPMVFGRLLCGWGCWRAMVLEHLPLPQKSGGRRGGWWKRLPLVGLGLSAAAAVVAVGIAANDTATRRSPLDGIAPVTTGIGVYCLLSVGLAVALRDRRAFCKYLCPTGQVLRWTSARSLFAVRATPERCGGCGTCSTVCPMDIDVSARARAGGRIGGGECIVCQRCVEACPRGALAYRRAG